MCSGTDAEKSQWRCMRKGKTGRTIKIPSNHQGKRGERIVGGVERKACGVVEGRKGESHGGRVVGGEGAEERTDRKRERGGKGKRRKGKGIFYVFFSVGLSMKKPGSVRRKHSANCRIICPASRRVNLSVMMKRRALRTSQGTTTEREKVNPAWKRLLGSTPSVQLLPA